MTCLQSSQDSLAGNVCAIEGLPPLPKGLSGILNSSGGSWREIEKVYTKKTRIQDDLSKSQQAASSSSASSSEKVLLRTKPANLDSALALLRKEMVGLRQLDMSLLCQLWSLYESIQEYKGLFQDMSSSLHSEGSLAAENGFSDEEEDFEVDHLSPDGHKENPLGQRLRLMQPQNSRDQWLKDSFHITI
ncbi:leucine repeat adapter protein 25 [Sceloporus undulatus]|uniref:leucine repeat adapter protein 25 n=1 Tax=Sceloporus undulatus TaxID=8520 RepID=UPI001C4CEC1B|nr:leucine repeat adapter protein 25 [Sceloporus undulatus]